MSLIILPADEDTGDWCAEARLRIEPDGTITLAFVRLWRDDFEPDDFSEQAEQPKSYCQ
ncbi:hypothetical protein ACWIGM_09915 [Bosea sp. NPDC055332]